MANSMSSSHIAKSRILEEIIIEIRKKDVIIPTNIMSDLKSARTLMQVESTSHQNPGETEPKIDQYLSSAEANIITEAAKLFPNEKVEKWIAELDLASCETCVKVVKPKVESKFISGVPRDQKWIRAEPLANQPIEKLEQLAVETGLSSRPDKDGHLIVYGEDKKIKEFIKKIAMNSR